MKLENRTTEVLVCNHSMFFGDVDCWSCRKNIYKVDKIDFSSWIDLAMAECSSIVYIIQDACTKDGASKVGVEVVKNVRFSDI